MRFCTAAVASQLMTVHMYTNVVPYGRRPINDDRLNISSVIASMSARLIVNSGWPRLQQLLYGLPDPHGQSQSTDQM